MSPAGLCVEGIYPVSPGSSIIVEFCLPGVSRMFSARARVIWVKERGTGDRTDIVMGIEFLNLTRQDRDCLNKLSTESAPK